MLTVFTGDDTEAALEAWLASLAESRRAVPADVRLEGELLNEAKLEEYINSASMFGGATRVSARDVFASSELGEFAEKHIKELAASANSFAFLEAKVPAALRKKLEKLDALKLFEKNERVRVSEEWEDKQEKNRIYSVADALGRRDRKGLWVEYWRLVLAGFSGEEIFWKLQWQVKNMLLAPSANSATEAGMSPYPFDKARVAAKNFKRDELVDYSRRLLDMWGQAHLGEQGGGQPLDLALEQFILAI
ncbi:MAG TPA: hypothetical protein VI953_04965 [Candidatus Paceibacterota bacterium]